MSTKRLTSASAKPCFRHGRALLTLMAAFAGAAVAQTTGAANLVGTVTDSTGAVVVAAKVRVVDVATAFVSESQTGSEGSYYVPDLSPGTYRLTVEAVGFKQYVRDGIAVRMGETPRIDVQLEVGAASEQVTVTAAAPLLATETAAASSVMEGATLVEIPVPQKRLNKFLIYFPGFTTDSGSGFHVEGQRQRAIAFTLDGISGKVPGTGAALGVNDSIHTVHGGFVSDVHGDGAQSEFNDGYQVPGHDRVHQQRSADRAAGQLHVHDGR